MILELRPNISSECNNFNGYFLSLNSIPSYNIQLQNDVDQVQPSEEQYSYIHAKLFSFHNHLFNNPWTKSDLYLIDNSWRVQKCVFNSNSGVLEGLCEVWELPSNHPRMSGHYPVTMLFPTHDLAVLSDGAGTLHIVSKESKKWQLTYSEEVVGKEKPFVIVDSRSEIRDSNRLLHILLLHVATEETTNEDVKVKAVTFLEWLTFTEESSGTWSLQCIRQLKGKGLPDFLALESDCQGLYIVNEFPFKFISDTESPITQESDKEATKKSKVYLWQQNSEEVKFWFTMEKDALKQDIKMSVDNINFTLECKDKTILKGSLYHNIDNDLTTWTLDENRILNIVLQKQEHGLMWQTVIKDDETGQEILDDVVVQQIHEQLSHLCSEEVEKNHEIFDSTPTFNMEQLEECDNFGESQMLSRIDRVSHKTTHQYSLAGHQWLFSVKTSADAAPALCVRHDVHGCLWQPEALGNSEEWKCTHACTFPAYGYVHASKQNRKFSLSAVDTSYTVICEANNHIYVYYKDTSCDLRHRRSGNNERTEVGKLSCIKVDTPDSIIGAFADDSNLFILTLKQLFQYHIRY